MEPFPSEAIDKVPQGGMSNYRGCNKRERRGSLVIDKFHWPSLFVWGEGRTLLLTLAER